MPKRKTAYSSDEHEDGRRRVATSESPERPLQTARRTGKKAKKAHEEESSEEETLKKPTKPRSTKQASTKKRKVSPPAEHPEITNTGDIQAGVNQSGELFVELGKKRRATVNMFKGGRFVDIREFYGDESDLKPGKKGISLTQEQWETLKKSSGVIDSFFAKLNK